MTNAIILALVSLMAAIAALLLARPAWRSLRSTGELTGWIGRSNAVVIWMGSLILLLVVATMTLAISSAEPNSRRSYLRLARFSLSCSQSLTQMGP